MSDGLRLQLPPDALEALVEQVAALVVERIGEARAESPWLTVREVAAYTKLPVARVYKLTAADAIPCHRVGSRILVHRAELDSYLEQLR